MALSKEYSDLLFAGTRVVGVNTNSFAFKGEIDPDRLDISVYAALQEFEIDDEDKSDGISERFDIILNCDISQESELTISVLMLGAFALSKKHEFTKEEIKDIKNYNAPAMVYPYLRSFVSTLTSNLGGINNIVLETKFFANEELLTFENLMAKMEENRRKREK